MDPRHRYERDGFLVLERFATPAACDALIARAGELVRGFAPDTVSIFSTRDQARTSDAYFLGSGDQIRCFFEEEAFAPDGSLRRPIEQSINKIGHAIHDLDPVFSRFSRDPRLAELAGVLGLAQPLLLQSMYIFKQPFIGGEVAAHQDHTFLWTDPPSVMGLWFALEDATVDNGCLWARPGGHAEPPRKRFHRARDPRRSRAPPRGHGPARGAEGHLHRAPRPVAAPQRRQPLGAIPPRVLPPPHRRARALPPGQLAPARPGPPAPRVRAR
jgi:phytanoyl-CoA hydroxylase